MSSEITLGLGQLSRAARYAEYRLRFNAALRRLALLLPVPVTCAAAALTFVKLAQPASGVVRGLEYGCVAACAVPLFGVLAAWFGKRPRFWGALTLDRHYATADRITNALTFTGLGEQSPMMQAAVADAVRRVQRPSARLAVPLRLPADLWVSVLLLGAVLLLSQLELRSVHKVAPVAPAAPEAILLGQDDIDLLARDLDPLARDASDPELSLAVKQFNQLLEDIAERKLDRAEVFRRTAALEQALFRGADADGEALDEALKGLAEQLKDSRLSAPVADALEQRQLPDAELALKKLAERLRSDKSPSQAELERLRKALASAAKSSEERVGRLQARRRELEEQEQRRLLKKKGDKDKDKAEAPNSAAAEQHQRRLERLDRDLGGAKRAREAMTDLDRDLAKAAEELMREMGQSAEHLEAGAQDMNRMAQKQMTQAQKQALKERLEQLKELMRQGGAGKEEHQKRLRNFGQRAQGQDPQAGQGQGQGQGNQGDLRLSFGRSGQQVDIEMPGSKGRSGAGREPGSGSEGSSSKDKDWGSGTNDALKGKPTDLESGVQDVAAAAVDTGQGAAASEVVYGAAERGFVGRGYKDVYTQYRTVMEDSLSKDEIPAGYEFYVRRYFQLIRPR